MGPAIAPAAALRAVGNVARWDEQNGSGFIAVDGMKNVFVHKSELPAEIRDWNGSIRGCEVTFTVEEADGQLKARDVHVLIQSDGAGGWELRREAARPRHSRTPSVTRAPRSRSTTPARGSATAEPAEAAVPRRTRSVSRAPARAAEPEPAAAAAEAAAEPLPCHTVYLWPESVPVSCAKRAYCKTCPGSWSVNNYLAASKRTCTGEPPVRGGAH